MGKMAGLKAGYQHIGDDSRRLIPMASDRRMGLQAE